MKRIVILVVFFLPLTIPQAGMAQTQFDWPAQDAAVNDIARSVLTPAPASFPQPQWQAPTTDVVPTHLSPGNFVPSNALPSSIPQQQSAPAFSSSSQQFQFAGRATRRNQKNQVTLDSWDQLPMHKHALVQAEMTRNGDGAVWRTRLQRPMSQGSVDIMDTRNFSLFDYRKMFREARTPAPQELIGQWRGVNKGIVNLVGYNQFIKEIMPTPCDIRGDNILVEQVSNDLLRSMGWAPVAGMPEEGYVSRQGFFQIQPPRGKGMFSHGAIFSYRDGQNERKDPVRLLVDKVVVLDRNHLLGRVTANFGLLQIPLSYFTLERVR